MSDTFYLLEDLKNGYVFVKSCDGEVTKYVKYDDFINCRVTKPIRGDNESKIGLCSMTNKNELVSIIEYNNSNDIKVMIHDENHAIIHTALTNFKRGEVLNPYRRSYFGKGYLGEGFKPTRKDKSMVCWQNMLKRSYTDYYATSHPTYLNCEVCDEWLNFQNFHKWYLENIYSFDDQVMCLDKDIIIKNNKLYSPDTCIFVPQFINKIFTKRDNDRGDCPIGVHRSSDKNKYVACCSVFDRVKNESKRLNIGEFDNMYDAFVRYKEFKENYIQSVAYDIKSKIPQKLFIAMINYKVEIDD